MTTINFADLMNQAERGFDPVPPDTYDVQVAKADASKPTSTGKPMIKVQYEIVGGPHNGRKLFDQFVVSAENPTALGFFFDNLSNFGLDHNFFAANPPIETVAQTLANRRARVKVGMREWQGKEQNNVEAYYPPTGGQGTAPAPSSVPQPGAQPQPQPPAEPAPSATPVDTEPF